MFQSRKEEQFNMVFKNIQCQDCNTVLAKLKVKSEHLQKNNLAGSALCVSCANERFKQRIANTESDRIWQDVNTKTNLLAHM